MRRCWLTFAAAALVTGAYAAQVAVPAAETSPAPISRVLEGFPDLAHDDEVDACSGIEVSLILPAAYCSQVPR